MNQIEKQKKKENKKPKEATLYKKLCNSRSPAPAAVMLIFLLHFGLTVDREVDVPVWVVLGRSCGLCWRSWVALGAYVGGLGPLLGPLLAVLGRSRGLSWRSWPLLGPPKAVLGRDQGEKRPKPGKVAQTRAGIGSQRGRAGKLRTLGSWERSEAPKDPICLRARYAFFL